MPALLLVTMLGLGACATGTQETINQVDKAEVVALQGALQNASLAQETVHTTTGTYATDVTALKNNGMTTDPTVTITVVSASATAYCMQATKTGLDATWHYNSAEGRPAEGTC